MATLRKAQLDVRTAQTKPGLGKHCIAPMAGTVMTLNVTDGQAISANSTIMTIDDVSQATIQFYLIRAIGPMPRSGYTTSVSFDALSGQTFTGKVTEIMPGLGYPHPALPWLKGYHCSINRWTRLGADRCAGFIDGSPARLRSRPDTGGALHLLSDGSYTVFVITNGKPSLRSVVVGLKDDNLRRGSNLA